MFGIWWGKSWRWASRVPLQLRWSAACRAAAARLGPAGRGEWLPPSTRHPWERTCFSFPAPVSRPAKPVRGGERPRAHKPTEQLRSRLAQLQGNIAVVFSFLKAEYREDEARLFLRWYSWGSILGHSKEESRVLWKKPDATIFFCKTRVDSLKLVEKLMRYQAMLYVHWS